MGFNPITYALIKKESERASTGISNVSVSDDGKSIIFTETNGNKLSISQSDWEALTPEEREKISKLIITGLGDSILCDDGTYRSFIPKASYNYNDIEGKPSINGVVLEGNKTLEELKFSEVSKTGSYNSLTGLPNIPSKVSDVTNNSAFITRMVNDLVNYYSKTSIYTKQESENLISQAKTFSVEIVEELPTNNISSTVIYLRKESGSDFYTQWIYVESTWITIGSTEIDMSNFYTISETDVLVDEKVDKVEGYGLSQENFSPENKDKLETYQEYKPSIISKNNLGVLRVDGETIVIKNGVLSSPSGGGGMEPLNTTDIGIEESEVSLTIKWKDPDDRIISGQTVSKWKGTKLVYKVDSYPKNESDGILVVDNTIRNQYENNGFIVTGLTGKTTYYFQLFPYSDTMVYNNNEANRVEGTLKPPMKHPIMTAVIDTTNSNPETSITYADDALTMVPGSDEWDKWFGIYPCLLKKGIEVGRLDPNDFTKFEDGTNADITSGNSGDVMIAFPRMGLKIETIDSKIYISMTSSPNDPDFYYYAHQRGTVDKNIFYLGAYKSSANGRSLSGKSPLVGQRMDYFRGMVHLLGTGYELSAFYQLTFRQAMYVLKYKNLHSQSVAGSGYTLRGSTPLPTGTTNKKGMNFRSSTSEQMKLFGIEDFWGNIWEWTDGIHISATRNILTATTDYNDTGVGYKDNGIGSNVNITFNYIKEVQGSTDCGFLIKNYGGSNTTYYCDSGALVGGMALIYGGDYNSHVQAGAFIMKADTAYSSGTGTLGIRLMYL